MAICPNDLITIAVTVEEGNAGRHVSCCFDEGGGGERGEFTAECTEFAECGRGNTVCDRRGRVPKWDERGHTPRCFAKSGKVAWNQRFADL